MFAKAVVFAGFVAAVMGVSDPGKAIGMAIGSKEVTLEPISGKSNGRNPGISENSIGLWCQMVTGADPEADKVEISEARWSKFDKPTDSLFFAQNVTEFPQEILNDNTNASIDFDRAPVTAAGKYRCDLWDKSGAFYATGNLFIHMRPVMHSEDRSIRLSVDDPDDKPFEVKGGSVSVSEGGEVSLFCPAISSPPPSFKWMKGDKDIQTSDRVKVSSDGKTLNISQVEESDRAIYKCVASNSFSVGGESKTYEVSLQFQLRIKGHLSWLWPLIAIIIMAILLALIIIVCELRRKKKESAESGRLEPVDDDE